MPFESSTAYSTNQTTEFLMKPTQQQTIKHTMLPVLRNKKSGSSGPTSFFLALAALILGLFTASAAITPYSWQRFDTYKQHHLDSTGNNHVFGGFNGNGESPRNTMQQFNNVAVGGPLGSEGYFSAFSIRTRANGNNQGCYFSEPSPVSAQNYAGATKVNEGPWGNLFQSNINWVVETWYLPARDGAGSQSPIFATGLNRNNRSVGLQSGVAMLAVNGIGFSNSTPASVTPGVAMNDGHVFARLQAQCPVGWSNAVDGKTGDFLIGPPILIKTPTNANWVHLAVVRDDSGGFNTGTVAWYTNGTLVASVPSYRVCWTNEFSSPGFAGVQDSGYTAGDGGVGLGGGAQVLKGYTAELRWSYFAPGEFSVTNLLTRRVSAGSPTVWFGPAIVRDPQNVTVWEGAAAQFSCVAATDTRNTYQWQRNGVNIGGATARLYVKEATSVASDNGAQYRCIVTNPGGSVTSAVATVTVVANTANLANGYSNTVFAESSLVTYLPMDGSTGTTLNNVKNPANNGAIFNAPFASRNGNTNVAAGNQSFSVNVPNMEYTGWFGLGTNAYGYAETTGNNTAWDFANSGGNGTVEAVIYLEPSSKNVLSSEVLYFLSSATVANSFDYYNFGADYYGNIYYQSSGSGGQKVWAVPGGLVGKRRHVAFVFSGAGTLVTLYVDGQNLGTKGQIGFGNTPPDEFQPITIGKRGGDVGDEIGYIRNAWRGSVDDVAIYSASLSAGTISSHFYALKNGTALSPVSIASISPSKTLYTGFPVQTLSVVAAGSPPYTYQWQLAGVNLVGEVNPTLSVATQPLGSYSYSVVVQGSFGSAVTSAPIVLTVSTPTGYDARVMASSGGAPKAYYPLNETSGTTVFDYAGTHDGVLSGSYQLNQSGPVTNGIVKSIRMFGTNLVDPVTQVESFSQVEVPYYPELNPENNGKFSHEFWYRPDDANVTVCPVSSQFIVGNNKAGMATMHGIGTVGVAQTTVQYWTVIYGKYNNVNQGISQNGAGGPTPAVNGEWQHIADVADGDAQTVTLYVNGTPEFVQNQNYSIHPLDTSTTGGVNQNYFAPLILGNRNLGQSPIKGSLSQVAIYDYPLSYNDITNHSAEVWSAARFGQQTSASQFKPLNAEAIGYITNNTALVVTNVTSGSLAVGASIAGAGIIPGTTITVSPAQIKVVCSGTSSSSLDGTLTVSAVTNLTGGAAFISIGTVVQLNGGVNGNSTVTISAIVSGSGAAGTYKFVGGNGGTYPTQAQDANNNNVPGFGFKGGGVGLYTLSQSNLNNTAIALKTGSVVAEAPGATFTLEVPLVFGVPNVYEWNKDGAALVQSFNLGGDVHYPEITNSAGAIQGLASKKLIITQLKTNDTGLYTLKIYNPLNPGGFTNSTSFYLYVSRDTTAPTLSSVLPLSTMVSGPVLDDVFGTSGSGTPANLFLLKATFSERMSPSSATNVANYILTNVTSGGLVSITNAYIANSDADTKFGGDYRTVGLVTAGLTPGASYKLTVQDLYDQAAFSNKIATTTSSTFVAPVLTTGAVSWNYYYKIDGLTFAGLALGTNTAFPFVPQVTASVTNFSSDSVAFNFSLNNNTTFTTSSNQADNYASTLTAWFTPTNTGYYEVFFNADDSFSKLYMNTAGASPAGATLIGQAFSGSRTFQEFESYGALLLNAGQPYFMQVVHKENGGSDFVRVGVRYNGTINNPYDGSGANGAWIVDSTNLPPIPGELLSSYGVAAPTILVGPKNSVGGTAIVASAGTVTNIFVTVAQTTTGVTNFTWQRSNAGANTWSDAGVTTRTNTFNPLAFGNYGDWRCKVDDGNLLNPAFSSVLTIRPPNFSVTPLVTPLAGLQGSQRDITVVSTASSGSTFYQWKFNGVNLVNSANYGQATGNPLQVKNYNPSRFGSYSVVVSDGYNTNTSTTTVLSGYPNSPTVTSTPGVGNVTLSFLTTNGVNYVIEYKNNVTDSSWTTLSTVAGSGSVTNPVITTTTPAQRFFRVRLQ